jgi:high-affinity iron transporter
MGTWFSLFPTVESLAAQALAALVVIGSYVVARRREQRKGESSRVFGSADDVGRRFVTES